MERETEKSSNIAFWWLWVFVWGLSFWAYTVLLHLVFRFKTGEDTTSFYGIVRNVGSIIIADMLTLGIFLGNISVLHLMKRKYRIFFIYISIIIFIPFLSFALFLLSLTYLPILPEATIFLIVGFYFIIIGIPLMYVLNTFVFLLPLIHVAILNYIYCNLLFKAKVCSRHLWFMLISTPLFFLVDVKEMHPLTILDIPNPFRDVPFLETFPLAMLFGTVAGIVAGWPLLDLVHIRDRHRKVIGGFMVLGIAMAILASVAVAIEILQD